MHTVLCLLIRFYFSTVTEINNMLTYYYTLEDTQILGLGVQWIPEHLTD